MSLVTAALNGGEDYELLFTCSTELPRRSLRNTGIHVIGHITAPSLGLCMITRDGNEIELRAQGWNSLAEEKRQTDK